MRPLGGALVLFVFCAVAEAVSAQNTASSRDFPGNQYVKVRLALEGTSVAGTGTTNLAVIFDISPGWHLYWRNPGDSGLPPQVKVAPISGIAFGAPQWPVPVRHIEDGGLVDYIYERELVLIIPMTTSSSLASGANVTIFAEIDWLVCKEICVPGHAKVSKTWPTGGDSKPSVDARTFAKARARHPSREPAALNQIEIAWDGFDLQFASKGSSKMAFFPYENVENTYPEDMARSGESKTDLLRLRYGRGVTKLREVTGVLVVTRSGVESFHEISIPSPPAKSDLATEKDGRASGTE